MRKDCVKIIWSQFKKSFILMVTTDSKNYKEVYVGNREECEVILEGFVRVGLTDETDNKIRSDSHTGYCEMNLQSHPDLGKY